MITPNQEVAELTRRARESWQSLRRGESFEHWVMIGHAIDAFRRQLLHDLNINKPNQQYKEAMGAYLRDNGWQQPTKEDRNGIDNTTRVNLQHIVDRLPEIEAWRATLPLGNLLKQNHPNTVWRAFCKAFPEPGESDNGEKRKTETQRLRQERDSAREEREEATEEIARLTAEVETLTTRVETATAEAGFMWDETPEAVAAKMVKAHREKAIRLADAIRAIVEKGEEAAEAVETVKSIKTAAEVKAIIKKLQQQQSESEPDWQNPNVGDLRVVGVIRSRFADGVDYQVPIYDPAAECWAIEEYFGGDDGDWMLAREKLYITPEEAIKERNKLRNRRAKREAAEKGEEAA